MELIRLNKEVPVKAIPEKELQSIIQDEFNIWISDLLSLTDVVSAKRLLFAEPAIKSQCWSMGFAEIKKMFEMYADNKLSIKPIPNYFDRILFGKIVEAYKQQKKPSKLILEEKSISDKERENIIYTGVVNCFDSWKQEEVVLPGYIWVYEDLEERGLFDFSKEEKKAAMKKAKIELKVNARDEINPFKGKSILNELENKNSPAIINQAKRILLGEYFKTIKHIQDVL